MVNKLADLAVTTFLAEQIKNVRVAVIGDVMLDRYFQGEVKRISPEAPVPVTRITKINSVLGGAANVAANLAHLECKVFMGGVTGDDENRVLLEKLMDEAGIDYSGLVKSAARKTITKLRVLGGNQQMLRMDFEETGDLHPEEIIELRRWLENLLDKGLDGIIVSDYAKGVCSDEFCQWVIAQGHAYNIPVLIDPKGADWQKYSGCDFITPNLKEMCEAAGCQKENEDEAVVAMAQAAREKFNIKNVVVTRSERGMSLVNSTQVLHSPATAIEVFDVSGAGDTVAATLLASSSFSFWQPAASLSWQEIAELAATWKACGEKIVFTNGCFDILHVGHVTYLEKARNLGKHLIVGLNTDASVRRLKGETRPLVHELDRARVLAALACVDAVVLFDQDTPTELIEKIRPDILVKGGDYKPDEVAGREYAGEVRIIEFEDGYSTTGVVEKIVKMVKEGKL